ncbi:nitrate- and nitrite sensing domain-containing protein [Umezawaea sp. Da 62-37]|uniref:sensor histidine kinase n=1 Tax=Umezawaea sp. Da 62-37 TaxID=3075927 RepID=UPI0028F6D017|nr:nitrate- and nitrite sensing domain-containing protein [Umezawaea sp. Da 62-37]WNV82007.1 nitrate- and nitrite sensing domain-containing protein [Umezawaea sp. Da 62-37]
MRLRNWRLRTKLFAVLLIPTVAALALGGLRVQTDLQSATEFNQLANEVQLESSVADLVQQLQRERDLSASHVASGKQVDRVVLDRQLRRVNDTSDALQTKITELSGDLDPAVADRFRRAAEQLKRLNSLRNAVRDTAYPSDAVLRTYSESVENLLDLGEQAIAGINDPALVRLHLATNAIARIKEQESRKRGILLDAFQRQDFPASQQRLLLAANAELDAARNDFRKSATPDQAKIYDDTVTGLIVDTANDMQESALNLAAANQDLGSLRAEKWDIASTLTVNLTRDVENLLLEQLQNRTDEQTGTARAAAFRDSGIVLAALLLALAMALFVARSILNPLRILRRTALAVADHGLPEAVEKILADPNPQLAAQNAIAPVPITTNEEVGQVARAFDAVHGEAVRLAAEQALLRDNVNAMFVNLSRRSQALVERQLNLIDRLEQDEQDPDQLASLFELDHLATRMRRNSENLLVLSGTDLSRRLTRPVPAAEVLGAAVSEVEQYARVQVGQTPELTVQGRAVNDLVHLIAELLDNATAFSDPVTKVTVRTARTRKGELAIEIQDRGVGMAEQDIVDANERLADPPEVDVAVSRRMGLYVVARLAKRHDIKVRLRVNEDIEGGTTALVVVPGTLVQAPGAVGVPMGSPSESLTDFHPAQRASGIAGAFTSSTPRFDEDSSPGFPPQGPADTGDFPAARNGARNGFGSEGVEHTGGFPSQEFSPTGSYPKPDLNMPVSFVQRESVPDANAVPSFGVTRPEEDSGVWLPMSGEQDVPEQSWPERNGTPAAATTGEQTLFTAYEDRGEDASAPIAAGYETTRFEPVVPRAAVAEPEPERRNGHTPARKEVDHDLDAPTERLPIYEAVLSQWFQAVGSETSAAKAQAVPPAAKTAEKPAEKPAGLPVAEAGIPLSEQEEAPLPTRRPKPVPAVAPTTTEVSVPSRLDGLSASGLPKRGPRPEAAPVREPEPVAEAEVEQVEEQEAPQMQADPTAESAWQSPADEGWSAAQALLSKTPDAKTQAGLPKRVPKAQLVPGSAAPKIPSAGQSQRPPLPPRSPDAIRGRMSSLQQGVRRGRHALIDAYAGDQSSRQDEEQE